jgi:hypothetical protein
MTSLASSRKFAGNSIFGIPNWRPLVFVAAADAAIEFLDVGVIPTFAVVSRMDVNPFV